ncbi:unnamed protein product [Mesocestoides corti]|uniref:NADH:ubiquinone reductase (H(+)-translocating) n=1 Tax=Mesocestoides corti TaxID=53468 RepID=A0A0R3UD62_MESCO|nr:unnamed protein product [Mesocestoides corti]
MRVYKFFGVGFFLVFSFVVLLLLLFSGKSFIFDSLLLIGSEVFVFDSISFYLLLLVLLLGLCSQFSFVYYLSKSVRFWLFISLIFSCLCFCINHSESPYSERFLAGYNVIIYVILCFVFFTKVPLVPFHTWLPIVHAEATRIVSIFLRGYIMKLGLLGVYRCCFFLFDCGFLFYLFLCVLFCLGFFCCSSTELDGKLPFVGFYLIGWDKISIVFLYCLGHGLSAGLVFGLLWCFYDISKTRNWVLLKSRISGKCLLYIVCFSLLSLCSFPTTIQFFCEVSLVMFSLSKIIYMLFWLFYLFFSGLIPLVMCGFLLIRKEQVETCGYRFYGFLNFLFYMLVWCYFGVFFM